MTPDRKLLSNTSAADFPSWISFILCFCQCHVILMATQLLRFKVNQHLAIDTKHNKLRGLQYRNLICL